MTDVVDKRIAYSEAFKVQCMTRYAAGDSPVQIFRDAGLDSSLIGYKRIERCIARWRKTVLPKINGEPVPEKPQVPRVDVLKQKIAESSGIAAEHIDESNALREMLLESQLRRIEELERELKDVRAMLLREQKRNQAEMRKAERAGERMARYGIGKGAGVAASSDVAAESDAGGVAAGNPAAEPAE
ncbi:transposase [Bifidobacterium primatium]|uniref:Transposase n=1 Tax=Bifidobacterium primatium TaxID=2045438 RepID=A0A2M9H8Z1_9BIFI|nr:transposase [Bifidobacterium primatium]